jgi:hypothetical protein
MRGSYLYLGAEFSRASCLVLYAFGAGVQVGICKLGSDLGPFPMSAAGELYKYPPVLVKGSLY